ncbi:sulfite oxidase-like isoform X1 [Diabrotica undecimpunctata]|uniref:sulfite oxidase-like isoform X1 n=1 Tax=Diabrotica undecimpunctata TaxID=50387 RepID=UPI003B63DC27
MELFKGALRRLSTGFRTYQKASPTAQKFCNLNAPKNSSKRFPKSKLNLICGQSFPDYDFNRINNNDFSQNYYKQFHTNKSTRDRAALLKTLVIGGAFVGSVTYLLGKATSKVVLGEYDEDLPSYTAEDVAKHKTRKAGVWVSYNRGVYDITDYLDKNPEHTLQISAGGPVYKFSTAKENYDADSLDFLEKYRIGNLKLSPPTPKKVCYTPPAGLPFDNEPTRDPRLIPVTEKPFNGGPKSSLLVEDFHTPNDIFYIRNHLPVPRVSAEDFKLTIDVEGAGSKTFNLDEIKQLPHRTVTITAQCGGLRRQEMTDKLRKDTQGVKWEINGVGNATWTGVALIDALKAAGYNESTHTDLEHLQFTSYHSAGGPYVTGIPIHKVLNPKNNIMLCWEMNGQELTPDHGYPLRIIVPGFIGARWVKQIEKIEVRKEECQAHWHQQLYKYFGPHVTLDNVDYSSLSPVQDLPVMSAILSPSDQETVVISGNKLPVKGFAYSGGGNKIVRVEVSNNKGKTWMPAKLVHTGSDPVPYHFTWALWSCDVPTDGKRCIEIWVKATDSACNVQPENWEHIYNIRGVACTAFHKIRVNLK